MQLQNNWIGAFGRAVEVPEHKLTELMYVRFSAFIRRWDWFSVPRVTTLIYNVLRVIG